MGGQEIIVRCPANPLILVTCACLLQTNVETYGVRAVSGYPGCWAEGDRAKKSEPQVALARTAIG
jgi:hypothetical protein